MRDFITAAASFLVSLGGEALNPVSVEEAAGHY